MTDDNEPIAQAYQTPAPHRRIAVLNGPACESPEQLATLSERLHKLADEGKLPRGRFRVYYKHTANCARAVGEACSCEPEILFSAPNAELQ